LTIYINGSTVSQDTPTHPTWSNESVASNFLLATSADLGATWFRNFQGQINQVKIWDGAITQNEVSQSQRMYGSAGTKATANLRAHYAFDTPSASVALDKSGNGRNLGLFNITTSDFVAGGKNFWGAPQNVNYFDLNIPGTSLYNYHTSIVDTFGSRTGDYFNAQFVGFFKAKKSGVHTFATYSDDSSYVWIGDAAKGNDPPFNTTTKMTSAIPTQPVVATTTGPFPVVRNTGWDITVAGQISLTAGQVYPIRIAYGELNGGNYLNFRWAEPDANGNATMPTSRRAGNQFGEAGWTDNLPSDQFFGNCAHGTACTASQFMQSPVALAAGSPQANKASG
jgi:hypothetical protein